MIFLSPLPENAVTDR